MTSNADDFDKEDDIPLSVWTRATDNQLLTTNEDLDQHACIDDVATYEENDIVQNIIANRQDSDVDDDETEESGWTSTVSEAPMATERHILSGFYCIFFFTKSLQSHFNITLLI
ncbi:unnamed protein product [Hermetia illucens]|uniref:Uncharacterized protein n=1 Tax=Hermetia illucens TaxID=343691 RepID=A0A7R8URR7_HERIL|nr:unnamed protein product [Hermetia illucens]